MYSKPGEEGKRKCLEKRGAPMDLEWGWGRQKPRLEELEDPAKIRWDPPAWPLQDSDGSKVQRPACGWGGAVMNEVPMGKGNVYNRGFRPGTVPLGRPPALPILKEGGSGLPGAWWTALE